MSKAPKAAPQPTLEEVFTVFAKLDDTRGDGRGTHITLTQADKWLKQASILDGKKITYADTGSAFNKFRSRSIQYQEFVTFVEDLAVSKKIDPEFMKEMLLHANKPGAQPEKVEKEEKPGPAEKPAEKPADKK